MFRVLRQGYEGEPLAGSPLTLTTHHIMSSVNHNVVILQDPMTPATRFKCIQGKILIKVDSNNEECGLPISCHVVGDTVLARWPTTNNVINLPLSWTVPSCGWNHLDLRTDNGMSQRRHKRARRGGGVVAGTGA